MKLWASSTAPDTDFTAKLVDVYPPSEDFPGGFDLGVKDGIIRARYRNSLEHAELMSGCGVLQPSELFSAAL
jgi:predicted acyl esterase